MYYRCTQILLTLKGDTSSPERIAMTMIFYIIVSSVSIRINGLRQNKTTEFIRGIPTNIYRRGEPEMIELSGWLQQPKCPDI